MKLFKKLLKFGGISLLMFILLMIAIPYFFKDTIKEKAVAIVNENINATASLQDVSISLFANFPKATVDLTGFALANKEPFVGDTLFSAKQMQLKLSITDLISGNYNILGFDLKDASVLIHLNKEGKGNFDIALPSEEKPKPEESTPFALKIESYNVENLNFIFKNDDGNMNFALTEIFHKGKGDFVNEVLDLDTETTANVSFSMDKSNFMNKVPVALQAVLGIDLAQQKYTFKQNKAKINRMELAFDGFIQLLENGQKYDLTFSTPSSSFQNFLALIPEEYSKSIENVKTTGNFTLKGNVNGVMEGDKIPAFALEMFSENASLKYPDLPKTIRDINIDLKVNNQTGILNDTKVNLNKFTMSIDQDHFAAKANVSNVIANPYVDATLKGVINLANLSQAYPVSLDKKLSGILKMNVSANLDMNSVTKQQYQNIKSEGDVSLQKFVYDGQEVAKPFHIDEAGLNFSTSHIELSKFSARTGESDLNLNGRLDNLFGFLFKKEVLRGNFALNSTKLAVNDFMQPTSTATPTEQTAEKGTTQTPSSSEALKIPAFLDCTISANASTVIYDNLQLKNVAGKLIIKDEKVQLENLKTDIFGGMIAIAGLVSTKEEKPTFDVDLSMNRLNIPEAFTQITMLEKMAPIAKVVQGLINTKINVSGLLNNDFTPDLKTLSGNLKAGLVDAKIKNGEAPLISSLASKFTNLDLSNLGLKDLNVEGNFKDGKIQLKPFTLKYKDIAVNVDGSHGFDQIMDYKMTFNIPPQMLGSEANAFLSKLSLDGQSKIENIPVIASVGGTFKNPEITTDMKEVAKNLATQLAKNQLNSLKEKGTDALKNVISSNTDAQTATKINQVVEGLTTKKDSTINKVKEEAKQKVKEEAKKKIGDFLKGL